MSAFEKQLGISDTGVIESFWLFGRQEVEQFISRGTCDAVFWTGWTHTAMRNAIVGSMLAGHNCIYGGYPSMYIPLTWQEGSSMSHLARSLEPYTFLAPQGAPGNETIYRYIPYAHLAMKDLGWDVNTHTLYSAALRVFIAGLGSQKSVESEDMLYVQNNSTSPQSLLDLRVSGTDAGDFLINAPSSFPVTIPAYGALTIPVEFEPQAAGRKQAAVALSILSPQLSIHHINLTGYASDLDTDLDGISDYDETRDLNPAMPGVQNPFHPDWRDWTGSNGLQQSDGVPDGRNDWDGDGIRNRDEFHLGTNPLVPEAVEVVTFSNTGNWPFRIDTVEILGTHAADFSVATGGGLSFVAPGSSHELQVVFQPGAAGARSATLRAHYHDGVEALFEDIPLAGAGV